MNDSMEQLQTRVPGRGTREDMGDLQHEGKELYKKQDYEAALKCFNMVCTGLRGLMATLKSM